MDRPGKAREARVFSRRPFLSKEAKEVANRSSRRIAINKPEYVEEPTDPSMYEVMQELKHNDGGGGEVDGAIMAGILGELSYRQAIYYYLYRYCGYAPNEIILAENGHKQREKGDVNEIRNVKTVIRKAATNLDDAEVLERLD
jgi:hypothetical protein